jgi:hypothetical protein
LINGKVGSSIFLNCGIEYINYPKKYNWGHHLSILINKTNETRITIDRIDTGCLSNDQKRLFNGTMFKLYRDDVGDESKNIEIIINFSFEDFLKRKYNLEVIEYDDELCINLQKQEEMLFGFGFCVSWGIFFMVEIFYKGKEIYDIYDLIYSMEHDERAKFIFVWYDVFYTEMRKEITEIWQPLKYTI